MRIEGKVPLIFYRHGDLLKFAQQVNRLDVINRRDVTTYGRREDQFL